MRLVLNLLIGLFYHRGFIIKQKMLKNYNTYIRIV